jgi:hypothetical protein
MYRRIFVPGRQTCNPGREKPVIAEKIISVTPSSLDDICLFEAPARPAHGSQFHTTPVHG